MHQCDNCLERWTDGQIVTEIRRYDERVDEGGPEPSGECPECGALCYEVEDDGEGHPITCICADCSGEFARSLLEESKRFLELASEDGATAATQPSLHAALLLAFCSLEAYVNAIGEEFSSRPELSVHEKGLLLEQDVRLEDGQFLLSPALRISRLEDRIKFLHVKFGAPLDVSQPYWSRLGDAMRLRNKLTHPKDSITLTDASVGSAIQAIIDILNVMCRAIYNKQFPAANLGLNSKLDF